MKVKLMIQSLSPLALLTIIKNFSFVMEDNNGQKLDFNGFILANLPLLIVMLICIIWMILSAIFLFSFKVFKYADRKSGYSISIIENKEEDSLYFFLTIILPLLVDDVNSWCGLASFVVIVGLIFALMNNTKLFYANPVLSLLGYRVTEFSFTENEEKTDKSYIAISRGFLSGDHNIEYKDIDITGKVLFVKEMK
ncbi:MAG: hypothetical protein IJS03_08085 [Eubacterium sp.]|nr:hypothetical protein [Eubacterium sp.]